ncbi:unnamed protein product [Peronospora belbahrii]|uniref:Centromere protein J C-terminal domain-containing protein n=1 Tax=Peronospora belbahrii TaxID=622444 RepID=A0AAU9KMP4_9STRA|nr:unnamed protein product [Peronospora belbahrii]
MQRPDAEKKVVKHSLNDQVKLKTESAMPKMLKQSREGTSSFISSLESLSLDQKQVETIVNAPKIMSLSESQIQQTDAMKWSRNEVEQLRTQNDHVTAWKNASMKSTTSTDIMGIQNVRRSFEATQEREANAMAEFEAIERDLAAEKEAFWREQELKQQDWSVGLSKQSFCDNQSGSNNRRMSYSSFKSGLYEEEKSRRQIASQSSSFDDSLDGEVDSSLAFNDYFAVEDNGMSDQDDLAYQLRHVYACENRYGDLPSDSSAVSFDNSVPWDEDLALQLRQNVTCEQSSPMAAAGLLVSSNKLATEEDVRHQAAKREMYYAKHSGVDTNALGCNKSSIPYCRPKINASSSSLIQYVLEESGKDDKGNYASFSSEDDVNLVGDSSSINAALSDPLSPPSVQVLSSSRSTPTRMNQKLAATRTSSSPRKGDDDKRTRQINVITATSSRGSINQKLGSSDYKLTHSRAQLVQQADSEKMFPAFIEEKLKELEAEVKLYKAETLQLQKRKNFYNQEVKKLALERKEFEWFQQQQRLLIEEEWDRERTKMKEEAKVQERQWKLRINSIISHRDQKDCGELEMLKAQIAKMQIDENESTSIWKVEIDDMRQRVLDLEKKNRELTDEITFLKKDRLQQWEQYGRPLKERQETLGSASKFGVTCTVPSVLCKKNEMRVMNNTTAMKESTDEHLQRWNRSHENLPETSEENDLMVKPAPHNCLQSNVADSYEPNQYRFDRESAHKSLSDSGTCENQSGRPSVKEMDIVSDADNALASNAATYEWALPADGNDDGIPAVVFADQKSKKYEEDGVISASTSSLSEHKVVTHEIERTSKRKEVLYADGSRKIIFPDGNEKDIDANGHTVIKFTNGDYKELFPETGISVYYYYKAQTKLTTYPDNRKVYEFPNQQLETRMPNGTTEIQFSDGTKKTIRPNGDELSVFPDGTTMLEQLGRLREVTLLNKKKICYLRDGQMVCVLPNGQEIHIRSDYELKQLIESS